jgi:predicted ABC-type exoprotein transport system permease subunit
MKTIFQRNNRRTFTISLLFTLSMLSFVVLLLCPIVFHLNIAGLAIIALIGIVFLGGILIQMRSSPPW